MRILYLLLHSEICMPEHLHINHLTSISEVDCDIFNHVRREILRSANSLCSPEHVDCI